MTSSILLFSGGLDSYIAWHYLRRPAALFCLAGQSYQTKELRAVKYFSRHHRDLRLVIDRTLNLGAWEEQNHYIPYRNVFFSMIASLYAQRVYLVGIRGDSVDDKNPQAMKAMGGFYRRFNGARKTVVTSPFFLLSKSQIVRWYIGKGLPVADLLHTRSCYDQSTPGQCGACPSCFRRWVAFENNDIHEPYDSSPWKWRGVKSYLKKMTAGEYDSLRTRETMFALRRYMTV